MEVRLDTQVIPKSEMEIFKYLGFLLQGNGEINDNVSPYWCGIDEVEACI